MTITNKSEHKNVT